MYEDDATTASDRWRLAAKLLRALAIEVHSTNRFYEEGRGHRLKWDEMNENAKLALLAEAANHARISSVVDIMTALRAQGLDDIAFADSDPDEAPEVEEAQPSSGPSLRAVPLVTDTKS